MLMTYSVLLLGLLVESMPSVTIWSLPTSAMFLTTPMKNCSSAHFRFEAAYAHAQSTLTVSYPGFVTISENMGKPGYEARQENPEVAKIYCKQFSHQCSAIDIIIALYDILYHLSAALQWPSMGCRCLFIFPAQNLLRQVRHFELRSVQNSELSGHITNLTSQP